MPTTVQRAVNTDKDIFKVGNDFYMCYQGVWFVGKSANGPWEVAQFIPQEIYKIPASSPAHHVTYADWFWDPNTRTNVPRPRVEHNLDRTNTNGVHVAYVQALSAGWRVGGLVTANRLTHPKIPNYEIMNIPRDPGHSEAFNVGVGVSKMKDGATFGLDAIYEPIRTSTYRAAFDAYWASPDFESYDPARDSERLRRALGRVVAGGDRGVCRPAADGPRRRRLPLRRARHCRRQAAADTPRASSRASRRCQPCSWSMRRWS